MLQALQFHQRIAAAAEEHTSDFDGTSEFCELQARIEDPVAWWERDEPVAADGVSFDTPCVEVCYEADGGL